MEQFARTVTSESIVGANAAGSHRSTAAPISNEWSLVPIIRRMATQALWSAAGLVIMFPIFLAVFFFDLAFGISNTNVEELIIDSEQEIPRP